MDLPNSQRKLEVISSTALDSVQRFEPADYYITCQAGLPLADLYRLLNEKKLHFPFLESGTAGTVGGMVASGQLLSAGNCFNISRWILALKVAMPNGDIIKTGAVTYKSVVGYDLPKLFCGSFGTLGIIVEAALRLYPEKFAPFGKDLLPVTRKSPILGDVPAKPANRSGEIALRIKQAFDPEHVFPSICGWNAD